MRPVVVLAVTALACALAIGACGARPASGGSPAAGGQQRAGSSLVKEYRGWAIQECDALVAGTRDLAKAADSGDLARARSLYAPTRMHYERIEPIAESLGNLDPDIDAREGDVPAAEWRGFHRIEKALWTGAGAADLARDCSRLLDDVTLLRARLESVSITVPALAVGAVELLNEVATSKITGEEERYSHTDLYDFAANVEGARRIFDLLEAEIRTRDAALAATARQRFQELEDALGRHRQGSGYALYTALSAAQTRALAQSVDALADPLADAAALVGTPR